jgi:hypothetical protein
VSGGGAVGRGDIGERVLLEDMWEYLELENLPRSEKKLGKKVQDGKVNGSHA